MEFFNTIEGADFVVGEEHTTTAKNEAKTNKGGNIMCNLNFKQSLLWALLFLLFNTAKGQANLVPNPSFEQFTNCPYGYRYEHPDYWYQTNSGGGGYLNACSTGNTNVPNTQWGYQTARTGVAFVGMFYDNGNGNNYFQVKLTDSLITDKRYYIEYYVVNPKKYYRLACNNVSLFLSNKAVYTDTTFYTSLLLANAQVYNYGNPIIYDTVNWVKVSSIYRAIGGEQYITLGNFKNSNQTNYSIKLPAIGSYYNGASYSVDDVSVILLDSMPLKADAGRDTTIHIGDSAFIGSLTNGIDSLKWQILNSNNTIDSIRPGFWVHPLVNTCYVLTQTVNGYTSSDTVCVNVLPLPLKFLKYELSLPLVLNKRFY